MNYLKYIGFYDLQDSLIQRNYATSAANKMEYIVRAIAKGGQPVKIISSSSVVEEKFRFYKAETKEVCQDVLLKLPPSWGSQGKLIKKIRTAWSLIYLFIYLLLNTHKDEPIIMYHSLAYLRVILWAKKIRRFKLILETEEIYTDVSDYGERMKKSEYGIFDIAEAYFFSTELLNDKLNKHKKPYCVNYGTYQVEPQITDKYSDNRIHVVYAGTFDPRKGGAAAAAAAAEFLPENYHIHVCGFGSEKDTKFIKNTIEEINQKSKAKVTFEGLLKGRDFICFIQKCHIGLSTQNPNAAFNATSFPSKILSYMANGLSVVSIDIKAIKGSAVGPYIHFYKNQTPEEIAKAILKCNIDNDNRKVIEKLDVQFINDVKSLLNDVQNN